MAGSLPKLTHVELCVTLEFRVLVAKASVADAL